MFILFSLRYSVMPVGISTSAVVVHVVSLAECSLKVYVLLGPLACAQEAFDALFQVSERFGSVLETYLRNCGDYRTELGHQLFVMSRLEQTAYKVRLCGMRVVCAFAEVACPAIQAAGTCDCSVCIVFLWTQLCIGHDFCAALDQSRQLQGRARSSACH